MPVVRAGKPHDFNVKIPESFREGSRVVLEIDRDAYMRALSVMHDVIELRDYDWYDPKKHSQTWAVILDGELIGRHQFVVELDKHSRRIYVSILEKGRTARVFLEGMCFIEFYSAQDVDYEFSAIIDDSEEERLPIGMTRIHYGKSTDWERLRLVTAEGNCVQEEVI